jgi:demethylmenaquinone methyltransferase/2-methoxy-6-polyprenyl-1,4-benzoquinol methylase
MTNPRRPYFNGLAADWDGIPATPNSAGRISRFLERSHRAGARRVLDVGCGTGILVSDLLNLYGSATCLVEFDLAEDMLRVNSAKFPGAIIGRVCADAQTMPFSDACFDLAVCFSALPHMPDKSAALCQILRVLRPGGVICVGHLMGSNELNAFHSSLEGPVAVDFLPPAAVLAQMLKDLGAVEIEAEENSDWYFVRAEKS